MKTLLCTFAFSVVPSVCLAGPCLDVDGADRVLERRAPIFWQMKDVGNVYIDRCQTRTASDCCLVVGFKSDDALAAANALYPSGLKVGSYDVDFYRMATPRR